MSERRHLIEARAHLRASQLSLAITLAYFYLFCFFFFVCGGEGMQSR